MAGFSRWRRLLEKLLPSAGTAGAAAVLGGAALGSEDSEAAGIQTIMKRLGVGLEEAKRLKQLATEIAPAGLHDENLRAIQDVSGLFRTPEDYIHLGNGSDYLAHLSKRGKVVKEPIGYATEADVADLVSPALMDSVGMGVNTKVVHAGDRRPYYVQDVATPLDKISKNTKRSSGDQELEQLYRQYDALHGDKGKAAYKKVLARRNELYKEQGIDVKDLKKRYRELDKQEKAWLAHPENGSGIQTAKDIPNDVEKAFRMMFERDADEALGSVIRPNDLHEHNIGLNKDKKPVAFDTSRFFDLEPENLTDEMRQKISESYIALPESKAALQDALNGVQTTSDGGKFRPIGTSEMPSSSKWTTGAVGAAVLGSSALGSENSEAAGLETLMKKLSIPLEEAKKLKALAHEIKPPDVHSENVRDLRKVRAAVGTGMKPFEGGMDQRVYDVGDEVVKVAKDGAPMLATEERKTVPGALHALDMGPRTKIIDTPNKQYTVQEKLWPADKLDQHPLVKDDPALADLQKQLASASARSFTDPFSSSKEKAYEELKKQVEARKKELYQQFGINVPELKQAVKNADPTTRKMFADDPWGIHKPSDAAEYPVDAYGAKNEIDAINYLQGKMEPFDLHLGNVGFDKNNKIKNFDTSRFRDIQPENYTQEMKQGAIRSYLGTPEQKAKFLKLFGDKKALAGAMTGAAALGANDAEAQPMNVKPKNIFEKLSKLLGKGADDVPKMSEKAKLLHERLLGMTDNSRYYKPSGVNTRGWATEEPQMALEELPVEVQNAFAEAAQGDQQALDALTAKYFEHGKNVRANPELMKLLPDDLSGSAQTRSEALKRRLQKSVVGATAVTAAGGTDDAEAAPMDKARKLADLYARLAGLAPIAHEAPEALVKVSRAKRIAEAFEALKHNPEDPKVKAAYDALIKETGDQYDLLKQEGLKTTKIKPGQENPYKSSKDMIADVGENNHLYYFPTEQGFGTDARFNDHPLLQMIKAGNDDMPANDAFRVVHDYFGHAKEGAGFGPKGEENAWREHMKMFSPEAQKALTTETRGQNSYVNYGPNAEFNRAQPAETIFADQKAGILPDFAFDKKALAASLGAGAAGMSYQDGAQAAMKDNDPVDYYKKFNKLRQALINKVSDGIVEQTVAPGMAEKAKEYNSNVKTGAGMATDPINFVDGPAGLVAPFLMPDDEE